MHILYYEFVLCTSYSRWHLSFYLKMDDIRWLIFSLRIGFLLHSCGVVKIKRLNDEDFRGVGQNHKDALVHDCTYKIFYQLSAIRIIDR